MTTDIRLDTTTGDYDLSNNKLELIVDNPEVVAQRIKIALQLRKGELFTNVLEGVPLREFTSNRDGGSFADTFMMDYIGSVEGVEEVINFSSSLDAKTRVYQPVVEVRTTSGQIITIDGGS